jgi:hypothetical protein
MQLCKVYRFITKLPSPYTEFLNKALSSGYKHNYQLLIMTYEELILHKVQTDCFYSFFTVSTLSRSHMLLANTACCVEFRLACALVLLELLIVLEVSLFQITF